MQKITTHLWFDKEAKEAAAFYTSFFENSKIKDTTTLHNTPSGSVDMVTIELSGQDLLCSPPVRFSNSIHLYRFLSPVRQRTRSMHYGKISQ